MILHVLLPILLVIGIPTPTYGDPRLRSYKSAPLGNVRMAEGREVVSAEEAVGGGWVELDAKLDMRAFFERLNLIPGIMNTLRNITSKIDTFDQELLLAVIMPAISGVKGGDGSEIANLKIAINELIQNLKKGPLDSNAKKILQILELLQKIEGSSVNCELSVLERLLRKLAGNVESQITDIQKQMKTEILKEDKELVIVSHNSELLKEILSRIEKIEAQGPGFGGGSCKLCPLLNDIQTQEREELNLIKSLAKTINNIPQTITTVISSEGGLGGIEKEIQLLIKSNESIKNSIAGLTKIVQSLAQSSEKYFRAHGDMMLEVMVKAKESAKTIMSSSQQAVQTVEKYAKDAARAARSAGRKCS